MRNLILLLLCAAPLHAQDAPDTAAIMREAERLFGERKYEEARQRYEAAATAAQTAGETETQTEATAQVARMYALGQNLEKGREWLAKAKELAKPEQKLGWSRYLGVRGRFEWQDEKDNPKATKTFIEQYDYCMKHELFARALDAAHMVAITGDEKQKIDWALKGIKAAEGAGNKGALAILWNNLGWTYDERNEVELAFDALEKAHKYHHEVSDDHRKLVADFGLAHAYRRVGKLDEARKRLDEAVSKARQRYQDQPQDKERTEWMGWAHKYSADLLADEGKPAEALDEYRKARPLLVKAGIRNWWPEGLKQIDDRIKELAKPPRDAPKGE